MRQAARMYMETQVTTTSQGQILIMLYDGAIKYLNLAKERIQAKDYPGKGKLISNAIDVINELASSLNAEKGGDLAANLNQLYFYCNKRLFMANARMDITAIDEVIKILGGIRSAYVQIIDTPEAVAAMAQATTPTAKGPRAPIGAQAAPAGAPVPAARARNAYAAQNTDAPTANFRKLSMPKPEPAATGGAPEQTIPEPELPLVEAAPGPTPIAMPDLEFTVPETPPPSPVPDKRVAAANLYRKFAS